MTKETFSEAFSYLFNKYAIYIILFTIFYILIYFMYIYFNCAPDKLVIEFENFKGFKTNHYSQLPNSALDTIDKSKNSHLLVYGSTGSGKTNFLKYYLSKHNLDYIIFGRHSEEWPNERFIEYDKLNQINFDKIHNKTIILDDLGAFKNLKTIVEDLFRNGRHNKLQIIYLAHYAKDVLPIVRENINKIILTINNSDTFFESIQQTYNLPKNILDKWYEYRNQNEYGIIEINTITKNYKIYNYNYKLVYNSKSNLEFDPSTLTNSKSYFF